MSKRTGNLHFNTGFRNGGRKAGYGMIHDDYSEESGKRYREDRVVVRLPHDGHKPEDLNGPVIIVQAGKKKL